MTQDVDISSVSPCKQEEVDSMIFLHLDATVSAVNRQVIVRATESVGVVPGVVILRHQVDKLLVAFVMQRHLIIDVFLCTSLQLSLDLQRHQPCLLFAR